MAAWLCVSALGGSAAATGCASIPANVIDAAVRIHLAFCMEKTPLRSLNDRDLLKLKEEMVFI
jgi:hypothetical protein